MDGFTTRAVASKRGRYLIADSTAVKIGDGERVGVGADSKGATALVWEFGAAQQALPLHAVATAVATGKTVPFPALVSAVAETGGLAKLKAAIKKHEDGLKEQASGSTTPAP